MLNKEKYAKELEQILVNGDVLAVDKNHNKIISCCDCSRCKFSTDVGCEEKRREWLNSEYVESVDWSQVAIDTPILVRDSESGIWRRRYFARIDDGNVCAWTNGETSWSAVHEDNFSKWKYAKLAEDIKQPRDNGWHNLKEQKPQEGQVLTWDGLGVQEDRWSDDADYFEYTDAEEIWWREMPEPPEV